MLMQPTLEKLKSLRLQGMLKAYLEQQGVPDVSRLSFEERLSLLVEREVVERDSKGLQRRLKAAKLKQNACLEAIELSTERGLTAPMVAHLASGAHLRAKQCVLITGPAGVGKTHLACALGNQACRQGYSAAYHRTSRLLQELRVARADGRYGRALAQLARVDVLILDDWALAPLTDEQRRDVLEVMEDRHGLRTTIMTSQLPIEHWHEHIGDPTLADAILDRVVHGALKLALTGDSMRKRKAGMIDTP